MKVSYNITQNKFNAILNQETTEIKVSFKTGYYPFPSDLDLSNYYTKSETYSKVEVDEIISEIPVVDTSNLVPYTGATQDVNIGAYYFESSKGFKTPSGTANQALTANGAVYDLTTKADLVDGKVPSSQLPSYVDDVLEFANLASFPATGESGKIYIALDTNITYRWTGTGYAEISASLALGETSSTAYRGDRGKIAYDHSQVTHDKNLVGLGNVDNTSDLNKPISNATQLALNGKQNLLSSYDESILVENDGNIENNVSLFEEYFEQQVCELNFTPIQIIGVYVNGIKQRPSLYTITLPKTITVTNFTSGDYIEIQYTKLKN